MATNEYQKVERNVLRMFHWVIIAAFLYFIAYCLGVNEQFRQLSTIAWKLANATVAAYFGYWFDRHLFRSRITDDSAPLLQIRRAIIVAAVILAVSMGL